MLGTTVATVILVFAANAFFTDLPEFRKNLYREDLPVALFKGMDDEDVFLTGSGSPLVYLATGSRLLFALPAYQTFLESDNRNADYIFLDAVREGFGGDWVPVWDAEFLSDSHGNRFRLTGRFESPIRTARLFEQVRESSPEPAVAAE